MLLVAVYFIAAQLEYYVTYLLCLYKHHTMLDLFKNVNSEIFFIKGSSSIFLAERCNKLQNELEKENILRSQVKTMLLLHFHTFG